MKIAKPLEMRAQKLRLKHTKALYDETIEDLNDMHEEVQALAKEVERLRQEMLIYAHHLIEEGDAMDMGDSTREFVSTALGGLIGPMEFRKAGAI